MIREPKYPAWEEPIPEARQIIVDPRHEGRGCVVNGAEPGKTKCKSCGAEIFWALTATHNRMPVDAAPNDKGNLVIGGVEHGVPIVEFEAGETLRYMAHFVTCPNAAKHRKRKVAAG